MNKNVHILTEMAPVSCEVKLNCQVLSSASLLAFAKLVSDECGDEFREEITLNGKLIRHHFSPIVLWNNETHQQSPQILIANNRRGKQKHSLNRNN